jgi:isoquinoline 1-oxidoreductase beta subunit
VDGSGKIVAWRNHFVSWGDGDRPAPSSTMGPPSFRLATFRITRLHFTNQPLWLKTGALRAPGSNVYAFVIQSFIDELAHAAGKDPVEFRLDLLEHAAAGSRATAGRRWFRRSGIQRRTRQGVVKLVAEKSGWGKRSLASGRERWASRSTSAIWVTSPKWPKSA